MLNIVLICDKYGRKQFSAVETDVRLSKQNRSRFLILIMTARYFYLFESIIIRSKYTEMTEKQCQATFNRVMHFSNS